MTVQAPWVDLALASVLLLSLVLGAVRGLLREVVSLTTWAVSLWLAIAGSHTLAVHLTPYVQAYALRVVISVFVLLMVGLLSGALLNALFGVIVRRGGLTGVDRLLGGVFGALRGWLLVGLLVWVGQWVQLQKTAWWHDAWMVDRTLPVATWLGQHIPSYAEALVQHVTPEAQSSPSVQQPQPAPREGVPENHFLQLPSLKANAQQAEGTTPSLTSELTSEEAATVGAHPERPWWRRWL